MTTNRRRRTAILAATALVAGASAAAPAVAAEGPIRGYGGQCLTAAGAHDGAAVTMQPCDGRATQQWTRWADGTVKAVGGGCLDAQRPDAADGTRVILWGCHHGPQQVFRLDQGGLSGRLRNPASGRCLDVADWRTDAGAPVQVWGCASGQANQTWTVPSVDTTQFSVGTSDLCLSAPSAANGAPVELQRCADALGEADQVAVAGLAQHRLVLRGKCVDLADHATTPGSPLQLWDCAGSWNQEWVVEDASWKYPGIVRLRNPATGMTVEPWGPAVAGGRLYAGHYDPARGGFPGYTWTRTLNG